MLTFHTFTEFPFLKVSPHTIYSHILRIEVHKIDMSVQYRKSVVIKMILVSL